MTKEEKTKVNRIIEVMEKIHLNVLLQFGDHMLLGGISKGLKEEEGKLKTEMNKLKTELEL